MNIFFLPVFILRLPVNALFFGETVDFFRSIHPGKFIPVLFISR